MSPLYPIEVKDLLQLPSVLFRIAMVKSPGIVPEQLHVLIDVEKLLRNIVGVLLTEVMPDLAQHFFVHI